MPWVRFLARFDWSPPQLNGRVTTVYQPGTERMVTTPCAKAAIAAGKAETLPKEKRDGRG